MGIMCINCPSHRTSTHMVPLDGHGPAGWVWSLGHLGVSLYAKFERTVLAICEQLGPVSVCSFSVQPHIATQLAIFRHSSPLFHSIVNFNVRFWDKMTDQDQLDGKGFALAVEELNTKKVTVLILALLEFRHAQKRQPKHMQSPFQPHWPHKWTGQPICYVETPWCTFRKHFHTLFSCEISMSKSKMF